MHDFEAFPIDLTRRAFLGRTTGLGAVALASLLNPGLFAADANRPSGSISGEQRWRGVVNPLHFRQRAMRVIFLYMAGGPSHLETLDYKPKLAQLSGEPMPESITKGQPIAQLQGKPLNCYAPQHPFAKYGGSGQQISTLFPNVGKIADEICIVRSMHTEAINHDPAHTFMNTGSTISGRPSMGSWLLYGLGSDADDLPGFVVMTSSGKFGQMQPLSARMWHSGFLPSKFQGVEFRSKGDPVLYVSNPAGVTRDRQQDVVAATEALNRMHNDAVDDPEILTRIAQYEMAFKMQLSIPRLMDISDESPETLELYGTTGTDGSFAANCLLARRLAERGVRFIQLYHRDWDHHNGIKTQIAGVSGEVDRPAYALITDLKRRGMLDETLVVWGGEFGRTPMAQGDGRDHHIKGYSLWLAGGGIKGGISYGATDEFGYNAVENPVHVNDFHATMLYLLGIDHTRLTYRYQGRDFRLTDVAGKVVEPILA
jgi:hypothetical protein